MDLIVHERRVPVNKPRIERVLHPRVEIAARDRGAGSEANDAVEGVLFVEASDSVWLSEASKFSATFEPTAPAAAAKMAVRIFAREHVDDLRSGVVPFVIC